MKFSIVVFPGSNCDHDCFHIVHNLLGCSAEYVWHHETDLKAPDAVILPGGFAYGDYLRSGAMARFSPVMSAVAEFAERGGPVIGICNGFQVLCEAGLLPGALLPNDHLRFRCAQADLEVVNAGTAFTRACEPGQRLSIPIKHTTGRYYAPEADLDRMEASGQVVLRYAPGANPNGSLRDIAGVCNPEGNVFGLMPHPEHAVDELTGGSADGLRIFASMVEAVDGRVAA